jgi:hypothetical protein
MNKLAPLLISLALGALFFLAAWVFVIAPTLAALGTALQF